MTATSKDPQNIFGEALELSRKAPLGEVRSLFRSAERGFLDRGDTEGAVGVLIEEARVLAASIRKTEIAEAHGISVRTCIRTAPVPIWRCKAETAPSSSCCPVWPRA